MIGASIMDLVPNQSQVRSLEHDARILQDKVLDLEVAQQRNFSKLQVLSDRNIETRIKMETIQKMLEEIKVTLNAIQEKLQGL